MSYNLPVWQSLSPPEKSSRHIPTPSMSGCVLTSMFWTILITNSFHCFFFRQRVKSCIGLHSIVFYFFATSFLWNPEAIINVLHNSYAKDFHEWIHEVKRRDEEWMETIDGMESHIHFQGGYSMCCPCWIWLHTWFRKHCEIQPYIACPSGIRKTRLHLCTSIKKLDDLFAQFAMKHPNPIQSTLV